LHIFSFFNVHDSQVCFTLEFVEVLSELI
jgi:hypothetical protein